MVEESTKFIRIDLNQFKLQLYLKPEVELTLHFDSPSRRFYLSVIGLVVHEMKKRGRITSIPLQEHLEVLTLLNQTIGGEAGSSKKEHLLPRIYRKWKDALPDLENAPLFKVIGRKKRYDELMDKVYGFSEGEKDSWANLFEYKGSHAQVRLRFSIDRLDAILDDVIIVYGESPELTNVDAWEGFIAGLKEKLEDKSQPERAYRKLKAPESPLLQLRRWMRAMPSGWQWTALFALIGLAYNILLIIVVGAAAFAVWKYNLFAPLDEVASVEKMAFPLPDKPSVAVLPFRNLSDDPKQDYFSDGLTEEIITGLSQLPSLFVIARNSTFTYKGKHVKVQQVSEELGVRYVLEGSVRKVENRVRITAQLIDAIKGHYLWAGRYDRELKDIFAVQDEITIKILAALKFKLTGREYPLVLGKYTDNLQAYLKILEGMRYFGEFKIDAASRSFKEARTLDPQCAVVYALEAEAQVHNYWFGPSSTRAQSLKKAFESAKKCAALDDEFAGCNMVLGIVYLSKREHDKAISEGKRAVERWPNKADAATYLGWILRTVDRHEESLRELERAIRLDPIENTFALTNLGATYLAMGRNEEAIATCKKVVELSPNLLPAYIVLALAYSSEGRMDEARSTAAKIMEVQPNFSAKHYVKMLPYKDETYKDLILNGLQKAGLR
jgi:TolB-like protein/Tfp pilus assembly protein PilF